MEFKEQKKYNFDSYYKKKGYNKKVWPILNEYFSRYQSKFDLSEEELFGKFNKVINNIDKIKIDGSAYDAYTGMFYPSEKKLAVNIEKLDSIKMGDEEVLNTIFHELNHAGERGEKEEENTSFQLYNLNTNSWEGTALNEIITEMKANLLSKNDTQSLSSKVGDDMRTVNLDGYSDLIFIGTMIHTSLGISEKEFLKIADKGKVEFDNIMKQKFPDEQEYYNFINSVSFYADTLHAIKYNKDTAYSAEDYTNMENCMNGIYDHCLYALDKTVKKKSFFERDSVDMKELVTEANFNLETLAINYKKGMSYNFDISNIEPKENVFYKKAKDTITTLDTIESSKSRFNNVQYSDMISQVAFNEENSKDYLLNTYGINKSESRLNNTQDLSVEANIVNKYYGDNKWDNSKVNKLVKKFKSKSFLDKLKEKFSFLKRDNNSLALPIVNEDVYQINTNNKLSNINFDGLLNDENEFNRNNEAIENNYRNNREETYPPIGSE